MAPKDQTRNFLGQFTSQGKEVSVTTKEAEAVIFAAAALTHMAENPGLYPNDWTTGAKANKAAILTVANKVKEGTGPQAQSPDDITQRLGLTPSRKRQAFVNLDDYEDKQSQVYKTAPKFGGANPFESPAKKKTADSQSEKTNPAAVATVLEIKDYYYEMADFMSRFGEIQNLEFDPLCGAVRDFRDNRHPVRDDLLTVNGTRIAVVFLNDKQSTACLFPASCVDGLMKVVDALRDFDHDNKTNKVPVCFILHALLRLGQDFGVVRIRYTEDNRINKPDTIQAWKDKYASLLHATSVKEMRHRVAGLFGYIKEHGVVKCHALSEQDVDLITAGIDDGAVDDLWGGASGGRSGRRASDID